MPRATQHIPRVWSWRHYILCPGVILAPGVFGCGRGGALGSVRRGFVQARFIDAAFFGHAEDSVALAGNVPDNAAKYRRIRVRLSARINRGLVLTVEDDGTGSDTDALDALTARGVCADESVPSTGLGLAITRDIVEGYGGALRRHARCGWAAFSLKRHFQQTPRRRRLRLERAGVRALQRGQTGCKTGT